MTKKNDRDKLCICGHPKYKHSRGKFGLCRAWGCHCARFVEAEEQGKGKDDQKK